MTILIAYDGSEDAKAAIDFVGSLVKEQPVVVLTVWERLAMSAMRGSVGMIPAIETAEEDQAVGESMSELAEQGARLAREVGLSATARCELDSLAVWSTIVEVADQIDATLIVTGTRGLGKVTSLLLGSTSDRVLHHAKRPVLTVPGADAKQ